MAFGHFVYAFSGQKRLQLSGNPDLWFFFHEVHIVSEHRLAVLFDFRFGRLRKFFFFKIIARFPRVFPFVNCVFFVPFFSTLTLLLWMEWRKGKLWRFIDKSNRNSNKHRPEIRTKTRIEKKKQTRNSIIFAHVFSSQNSTSQR